MKLLDHPNIVRLHEAASFNRGRMVRVAGRRVDKCNLYSLLAGGFNFFYINFHPYVGKIPNLTNAFQMGWFNHQLDYIK